MKTARVPRSPGRGAREGTARTVRLLPGRCGGRAQRLIVLIPVAELRQGGLVLSWMSSLCRPRAPCCPLHRARHTGASENICRCDCSWNRGVGQYGSHPEAADSHTEGWRHTQHDSRITGTTPTPPRSPSVIKVSSFACSSHE